MNTTATEAHPPALKPPAPVFEAALEAVELELSLGQKKSPAEQLESAIRETVESVGGVLLFQMKLDKGDNAHWVAAVAFDASSGEREIAVIDMPCAGGGVSVIPAAQSELPIASIAAAYAGLAECWQKAA